MEFIVWENYVAQTNLICFKNYDIHLIQLIIVYKSVACCLIWLSYNFLCLPQCCFCFFGMLLYKSYLCHVPHSVVLRCLILECSLFSNLCTIELMDDHVVLSWFYIGVFRKVFIFVWMSCCPIPPFNMFCIKVVWLMFIIVLFEKNCFLICMFVCLINELGIVEFVAMNDVSVY